MNPALRDSAAHVFVDDLSVPVLDDADLHHLSNVLRLRDGESVSASDGAGGWRMCEWRGEALCVAGDIVTTAAPSPRVGVAFVPVKGDRSEWTVQKLTEIGVDDIVVLAPTRRSVVRWSNVDKQLDKLRIVAREAAMQSRRTHLPTVTGLVPLADALARPGAVLADPLGAELGSGPLPALVVVGPEGGFDSEEGPAAVARVSLGGTILRAETATLVAATLLVAQRHVHAASTR
jgi:16S rRNA (uracil1498-N3)-methyltransferase